MFTALGWIGLKQIGMSCRLKESIYDDLPYDTGLVPSLLSTAHLQIHDKKAPIALYHIA
jgi:hypothetical protein